jgi:lambda repressor-like predicted transcriptional regulator
LLMRPRTSQPSSKGSDMKLSAIGIPLLVLLSIPTLSVHAQTARTREQVKAELAQAIRSGDMLATGDTGLKVNEMYPQRYPAPASAAQGISRSSVKADLAAAIRSGEMIAAGEGGFKENELTPGRYPAPVFLAGKTRAEVKAETVEAIRNGDVIAAGESGMKLNEQYPQRYAHHPTYAAAVSPKLGDRSN